MILRRYKMSTALLPLLLLCFSGCLHRKLSIQGNYTVEGNAGYPMLVPAFASTRVEGEFQTASVILQGARRANQTELNPGCAIQGDVFSLRPGNPADGKHWTIRSLSVQGWNLRGGQVDTDEQWERFVRELARMQQRGCFPAGLSVFSLQRAFAAVIPLPASDVQSFFYSANAEGFVNLSPGMQIKIEEMLGSREVTGQIHSSYAYYEVDFQRRAGGNFTPIRFPPPGTEPISRERKQSLSPSRGSFCLGATHETFLRKLPCRRFEAQCDALRSVTFG